MRIYGFIFSIAFLLPLVFLPVGTESGTALAENTPSEETWQSLKGDIVGDKDILDGTHLLTLEAPYRAHDAAIVPLKIIAKPNNKIKKIILVIDENPAPLVGEFSFGSSAANTSFSTRVRVNAYSYVRAIAETTDNKYYMVKKFVKASGGCSAPASKDMEVALKEMGRMKLRQFTSIPQKIGKSVSASADKMREAQILIRHPNNSGFQRDQVTLLHIPAHFVSSITVKQGDEIILQVEGGISLSEDPSIRFFYQPNGAKNIDVEAVDTENNTFKKSWPILGS